MSRARNLAMAFLKATAFVSVLAAVIILASFARMAFSL